MIPLGSFQIQGHTYTVSFKQLRYSTKKLYLLTRQFDGSRWFYVGSFLNHFSHLRRVHEEQHPQDIIDTVTQQKDLWKLQ